MTLGGLIVTVFVGSLVVLLIAANVVATYACLRDAATTGKQKVLQVALVWSLPILGSFVVLYFVADHHHGEELKSLIPWPLRVLLLQDLRSKVGSTVLSDVGHAGEEVSGASGELD